MESKALSSAEANLQAALCQLQDEEAHMGQDEEAHMEQDEVDGIKFRSGKALPRNKFIADVISGQEI